MKEGVHGVSYTDCVGEQGWTPVTGRKKIIPDYIKRHFLPDHPVHNQPSQESDESGSERDLDDVLPTGSNVRVDYKMSDNTPGLIIQTRCTREWTPVATRTRARLK